MEFKAFLVLGLILSVGVAPAKVEGSWLQGLTGIVDWVGTNSDSIAAVASTINKVLTKTVGVPGFDNVAYAAKISALEEERLESGVGNIFGDLVDAVTHALPVIINTAATIAPLIGEEEGAKHDRTCNTTALFNDFSDTDSGELPQTMLNAVASLLTACKLSTVIDKAPADEPTPQELDVASALASIYTGLDTSAALSGYVGNTKHSLSMDEASAAQGLLSTSGNLSFTDPIVGGQVLMATYGHAYIPFANLQSGKAVQLLSGLTLRPAHALIEATKIQSKARATHVAKAKASSQRAFCVPNQTTMWTITCSVTYQNANGFLNTVTILGLPEQLVTYLIGNYSEITLGPGPPNEPSGLVYTFTVISTFNQARVKNIVYDMGTGLALPYNNSITDVNLPNVDINIAAAQEYPPCAKLTSAA